MKKSFKRIISLILIVIMTVGSFTLVVYGASKTKTTTLYNCVKKDRYVYCIASDTIIRYDTKTGVKKDMKVKRSKHADSITGMKIHKGYIYYTCVNYEFEEDTGGICRIKLNGKSNKVLLSEFCLFDMSISGKKIYYRGLNNNGNNVRYRMNLNGKKKAKTNTKAKTKYAATNAKGYKITRTDLDNGYSRYYLKLPSGKKVYLATKYLDD